MKKILSGFLCLLFPCLLHAQVVRSYAISAEFFPEDAEMYGYSVSPDTYMRASALVEFAKTDKENLTFYLHGELAIDSIQSDSKEVEYSSEKVLYYYDYSQVALKVTIKSSDIGPDKSLEIRYSGFFNPSRVRGLSDYMRIHKDEGVFLRAYGYSLWFPMFLEMEDESYEADFQSVTVKVPADFKAIVAGRLVDESVNNNVLTSLWKPGVMDIMDVQCTARKYRTNAKDNIFVYYVDNEKNSAKILNFAIALEELYSRNLRNIDSAIPLYIMEMPRYGDISSGNVIGISKRVYDDFESDQHSKLTIAHELVHPYVSIPVSKSNPFCALVVEGFPSFFQVYALKRIDKKFDLEKRMKEVERQYLEKREKRNFTKEKPILQITFDEVGTYKDHFVLNDRVWLFIYDLWRRMGDENFDAFLKKLFVWDGIDYGRFEGLVLEFLPDFKEKLNTWLNTTEYSEGMKIQ
jgi:hypothetical protein